MPNLINIPERKIRTALKRSLSAVATKARKETILAIRSVYNIKARDLRKQYKILKKGRALRVVSVVSGAPIPLSYFGARPVKIKVKGKTKKGKRRQPRLGASVLVRKGRPRKIVSGGFLSTVVGGGAEKKSLKFINRLRRAAGKVPVDAAQTKTHIFKRKGRRRYPINALFSRAPKDMFQFVDAQKTYEEIVTDNLDKLIRKDIIRVLEKGF